MRTAAALVVAMLCVACGKADPNAAKGIGGAAAPLTQEAKVESNVVAPRDAASGLPTGKRQHKPVVVTKPLDNTAPAQPTAPGAVVGGNPPDDGTVARDAASGLATGKRQHKPLTTVSPQ